MQFILNADDFGRTKTANEAIAYGFKNGYLSRTTAMVNMPFYEEAKAFAKKNGFWKHVGLHINLTSGLPLTEDIKYCPAFTDKNGYFNSKIFRSKRVATFLTHKEKKAVRKEVEAQIEKFLADGFTLMHADSHGHVHTLPSLQKLVLKSLKKHGFRSVRIVENVRNQHLIKSLYKKLVNARFFRFNGVNEQTTQYFGAYKEVFSKDELWKSKEVCCEVMLHPNIYEGDMQIGQGLHYADIQKELLLKKEML